MNDCLSPNLAIMEDVVIQKQLDALREATKQATQTRETAIQFLIDAGIMPEPVLTVSCDAPKTAQKTN